MNVREWVRRSRYLITAAIAVAALVLAGGANWPNH